MAQLKVLEQLTHDFYQNVGPRMTKENIRAMKDYSYYSININNALLFDDFDDDKTVELIKNLKQAIKFSSLPTPVTTFHGTSNSILGFEEIESYLTKSDEINIKTFLSTSTEKFTASTFMSDDNPVLLSINIPKSYPALWMNPFSIHRKENELLLFEPKLKILEYKNIRHKHHYTYIKTRI